MGNAEPFVVEHQAGPMATPGETGMPRLISMRCPTVLPLVGLGTVAGRALSRKRQKKQYDTSSVNNLRRVRGNPIFFQSQIRQEVDQRLQGHFLIRPGHFQNQFGPLLRAETHQTKHAAAIHRRLAVPVNEHRALKTGRQLDESSRTGTCATLARW